VHANQALFWACLEKMSILLNDSSITIYPHITI